MRGLPGRQALVLMLISFSVSCDEKRETPATNATADNVTAAASATSTATSTTPSAAPVAQDKVADEKAIRELFKTYKKAIFAKDGNGAADVVSFKTLSYYETTRKAALTAPRSKVTAMPLFDRLMVLMMRARIKPKKLAGMTARDLFVHAVDKGWIGEEAKTLESTTVNVVDASTAEIGMASAQGSIPPSKGFKAYREGDVWKLDIMSIRALAEGTFEQVLRQVDPDPTKAILTLLSELEGRPITEDLLDPPKLDKPDKPKKP